MWYKSHNKIAIMPILGKTLKHISQCMRFPTMWYVRLAKPQISLRILAV